MEHLAHFAPLALRYDGFICDLWGVIHDGITPYPGARDVLMRLQEAGKRVVLLSNAPRRAAIAAAAMTAMGLEPGLYNGIMTSGEATWLALRDRPEPWFERLGQRVFHLGPARDAGTFAGLGLQAVARPAEASFVLNTGPDDMGNPASIADFEAVLAQCRAASLPMVCANPDLEVIRGGERVICAGALAARYAQMGGDVRSFGKPDPAIYAPVQAMLGTAPHRTLMVGDALRTDMAGAKAACVDGCWVLGGIHGAELGHDAARIEAAATAAGLAPVASLPSLIW